MGKWIEVTKTPYSCPCDTCNMGFAAYSVKEVKGKRYVKIDSCGETCEKLNKYRLKEANNG